MIRLSNYLKTAFLTLIFLGVAGRGIAQQLSDQAQFSLLTIAPTNELYNQFGHTALRLYDPVRSIDYCYNYGVYDFDTPNFYRKFVTGHLNYMMSVVETPNELAPYRRSGRGVIEQKINLNPSEVKKLSAFLRDNYKPENRYYLYDFFYDNCSTRIRDALEEVLDAYFVSPNSTSRIKSYRTLLDEKIELNPWYDFAIDFILGQPTDMGADYRGEMFLPSYLSKNLSGVTYQGRALLGPPVELVPNQISIGSDSWLTPYRLFIILFLIYALCSFLPNKKAINFLDGLLFFTLAFGGFFLLFMRVGTEHFVTWNNYNLLWANPLFIVAVLHLIRPRPWMKNLYWILGVMIFTNILGFFLPMQGFNYALAPLLLLIASRIAYRIYLDKKQAKAKRVLPTNQASEEEE